MRHALIAFVATALFANAAHAQQASQHGPGGPEIWDLSDAASPRHWFTGFRCWDQAGGIAFTTRMAFGDAGDDVSCIYERGRSAVTTYATLRTPLGAAMAPVVAQRRQQVRDRYANVRVLAEGPRSIETPAGPVTIEEYVVRADGADRFRDEVSIHGVTGLWHVDVAGWTLEMRLSDYDGGDLAWAQTTATEILSRAYADMATARACAGAGAEEAPNVPLTRAQDTQLTVGAALVVMTAQAQIPADAAAARAAGFVCLGQTFQARNGVTTVSVMQPPSGATNAPAAPTEIRLLALGETRAPNAPMFAIFDGALNPFGVADMPAGRAHMAFAVNGGTAAFYGRVVGAPPRVSAGYMARQGADGALQARVSVGPGQPQQPQHQ